MTTKEPTAAYAATAFHDQLRKSPGLSDGAVRVALILSGYADAKGRCWPSQRRVALDLDCSLEKVKRALRELQRTGIVEYQLRARHRGQTSTIQLRTGVRVGTGVATGTGVTSEREPVSDLRRTGVRSDPQNSPMNSLTELPQFLTGEDASAPGIQEGPHSAGEIVAHAVTVAQDRDLVLSPSRRGALGKKAKELLAAGADFGELEVAVATMVTENKPASALEYLLNDQKTGGGRRNGGSRTNHANDGRSINGEW